MELTSEQVHWIDGAIVIAVTFFLLVSELRPFTFSWNRFLIPAGLLIFGIGLFFDPLFHGYNFLDTFGGEIRQHIWFGSVVLIAALIETAKAFGWLETNFWNIVFPVGLVLLGAGFFFHAQHSADGSALLLLTQHRIMGITLILAGIAKAIAEFGGKEKEKFNLAWIVLLLLFGFELLLYTEGSPIFGNSAMPHLM